MSAIIFVALLSMTFLQQICCVGAADTFCNDDHSSCEVKSGSKNSQQSLLLKWFDGMRDAHNSQDIFRPEFR